MIAIKRLDALSLAKKLELQPASASFIFKATYQAPRRQVFMPHRSQMYTVALIRKGIVRLTVGLEHYEAKAPGLVVIRPDDIRQWLSAEGELAIGCIFFTEDFMASGVSNPLFLRDTSFQKLFGRCYIPLEESECNTLKAVYDLIEQKVNAVGGDNMNSLQAMTTVLLLEAKSLQECKESMVVSQHTQGHILAGKFKDLLARDFIHQRSVKYYADQLFVTPKHLSQSVKEQMGKTAGTMIDEIVGLEAKVMLQNVEVNIAQVSQALNFVSPTFFGKFFKRIYGVSPLEYRKGITREADI